MEPISLTTGVAALFKTCIDCFEYFKAAREFEPHFEVLLVKLEYQEERLLVWADLAGLCDGEQDQVGPISESEHRRQQRTKRCLGSIRNLLKDSETLKTKYGLRAYDPPNHTTPRPGITSNALKRLRLRLSRQSYGPGVLGRTRWAIYDEGKFQKLVKDIRELIDDLSMTVPVSSELQEQKIQDDLASMVDDIQSLHLFQEACKDDYPKWWAAASAAIDESEVGTLDNRLADERLEHYGHSAQGGLSAQGNLPVIPTHFGDQKVFLDTKTQFFFVLTQTCRAQDTGTPCDQIHLGTMSFQWQYDFIAPGSVLTRAAPGYCITKHIDPSRFTDADWDKYLESRDTIKMHAIENSREIDAEEDGPYRVKVYIYCAPCACQVATALNICRYRGKKDFVEFSIRIDYRQTTSCTASVSRLEGLVSMIDYIKEKEKASSLSDVEIERLKAIDREWLERQVYDYTEEHRLSNLSPANQLAQIAKLHKTGTKNKCAAVVLLGEIDYCIPLIGAPPFQPFEPGQLKETQLYRYSNNYNYATRDWTYQREYMGTYSPKEPLPSRQPPNERSVITQTFESAQRSSRRPRSSLPDEEVS